MRVELTQDRSLSKPDRIRALFDTTLQKIWIGQQIAKQE
jgi:hypothetical protein